MKIVLGNVLHKIEFPKSIKARAFSNTLNPNCSYTVFCFGKYRKYLSQNSCGGHVFNKFERGLPLVLSNVYPISWMHLFLFCNTAEQVSFLHAYFLWLPANLKVQANLIKFVKSSDLYVFFFIKGTVVDATTSPIPCDKIVLID